MLSNKRLENSNDLLLLMPGHLGNSLEQAPRLAGWASTASLGRFAAKQIISSDAQSVCQGVDLIGSQ
jgi:hypothetical protein